MNTLECLEQVGSRGCHRPVAVVTSEQATANTHGLTGFAPSLVTRPEIIDPQKIGVLMAQNRGVNGDVFTNETDALAWLDARI